MDDEKTFEPGTCGWAPGNYCCRCRRCGDEFIGDGPAVMCVRCAELLQVMAERDEERAEIERLRAHAFIAHSNLQSQNWKTNQSLYQAFQQLEAALTEKE